MGAPFSKPYKVILPPGSPPGILRIPAEIRMMIYEYMWLPNKRGYKDYIGFFMICKTIWQETQVEIPDRLIAFLERHTVVTGYDILPGLPLLKWPPSENVPRDCQLVPRRRAWFRAFELSDVATNPYRDPPMECDTGMSFFLTEHFDCLMITTHHWLRNFHVPPHVPTPFPGMSPKVFHDLVFYLNTFSHTIKVGQVIFRFAWSDYSDFPPWQIPCPPNWEVDRRRAIHGMAEVIFTKKPHVSTLRQARMWLRTLLCF
jgi:hypothetical protein